MNQMINKSTFTILLIVLAIKSIFCGVFTEFAPVEDDDKVQDGYTCKSADAHVGYMKEGEERLKYAQDVCGKVKCEEGVITYTTCAELLSSKGCYYVNPVHNKTFPGCCGSMNCRAE